MVWIIILVVVVLLVLWVIGVQNRLTNKRMKAENAFADIDVHLVKRYDLIPNLVETVKGYAKHEAETLEKVVSARNMAQSATTLEDKIQGENILSGTLKSLFAVAESYPDLKANQNFMDLQQQLKDIEKDIANSRKYYNAVVKDFNNKCEMFPSNIIAKIFNFVVKPMFEVEGAEERKNVKVQF